jgi:hypothetical protein
LGLGVGMVLDGVFVEGRFTHVGIANVAVRMLGSVATAAAEGTTEGAYKVLHLKARAAKVEEHFLAPGWSGAFKVGVGHFITTVLVRS